MTTAVTHRGPWSFTLPYPRPPRGLHSNDRSPWQVKARSTAQVRLDVFNLVRAAHVPALERIRVDVEWVVPDRRKRDADGPEPMLKAIFDGIGSDRGVSARIVEDDDPRHMDKGRLTIRREPGCLAHFDVTITELEVDE
ncbi:hypothetical protein [Rathayibacter sp. AY2B9]|uniref:hypothetical protein n=1 Tax=Rathayibacter sp. AY2B9 TaxID=2080572 RepID=UPI0011B0EDA3|nr:hypothetical protein [Rathayibacter sp. AY2B9]